MSPAVPNITPATLGTFKEGAPRFGGCRTPGARWGHILGRGSVLFFYFMSAFALGLPGHVGENGDPRPFVLGVVKPSWFCFSVASVLTSLC